MNSTYGISRVVVTGDKCGSTYKTAKVIVSQLLHFTWYCLFQLFELCHPRTVSLVYGTADFITNASLLASQSVLLLARTKDRQQLSPRTQLGLASGPCQIIQHITLANANLMHKRLIRLLHSSTSTCFEQYLAHPQEVELYFNP